MCGAGDFEFLVAAAAAAAAAAEAGATGQPAGGTPVPPRTHPTRVQLHLQRKRRRINACGPHGGLRNMQACKRAERRGRELPGSLLRNRQRARQQNAIVVQRTILLAHSMVSASTQHSMHSMHLKISLLHSPQFALNRYQTIKVFAVLTCVNWDMQEGACSCRTAWRQPAETVWRLTGVSGHRVAKERRAGFKCAKGNRRQNKLTGGLGGAKGMRAEGAPCPPFGEKEGEDGCG